MKTLLTILYEDSRGPMPNFGLHRLVMSCLFDKINGQSHLLHNSVRDHQARGDSNLLRKCCQDADRLAPDGHPVVAVFDNDRIRRLLGMPSDATDSEVKAKILERKTCQGSVTVVLLKENTESVLRSARECDPKIDPDLVSSAVDKKDLNARDIILGNVARAQERAVRDCLMGKNLSLSGLVDCLSELLRERLPSTTPA